MEILRLFDELTSRYRQDYGEPVLPGPALAAELAALERETSLPLPADLRTLLQLHDGAPQVRLLPDGAWLCSTSAMLEDWRAFAVLADEFNSELPPKPVPAQTHLDCVYHRRRLPIGSREDFHLCLDFAPGPAGVAGQVLMLCTECSFAVVGRDLSDFFRRWLKLLGSDRFRPGKDPAYWLPNGSADWGHFFLAQSGPG